jgi:polar amino acid transport system substrate-binding protein
MTWHRLIFFCLLYLQSAAAATFCFDEPVENKQRQPLIVAGQPFYGEHTARIATWLVEILPDATFVNLPWQRCMHQVQTGRITGLLSIGWTQPRAHLFRFPQRDGKVDDSLALYDAPYYIFVHRDSQVQWDGQRFVGLKYGLLTFKGYVAEQRLRQLNALAPLELDMGQAIDLLVKGRIDGYVSPLGSTYQGFLQHPQFSQVRRLELPFFSMPLFLAFHPEYCLQKAEQCEKIWQHLANRRAEFRAN